MSRQGIVTLPPLRVDLAISRSCARAATPARERSLQVSGRENSVGGGGPVLAECPTAIQKHEVRHEANRMLLSVATAGLLPHLFKYLINRKRPDRTLVHGPRHGIPRSGDAWDSFPSGHALHLGAIAGPLSRLVSKRLRPYVWAGLLGLASTRIMLLAHYASDVVAGLVLGAGLGKAVRKITE